MFLSALCVIGVPDTKESGLSDTMENGKKRETGVVNDAFDKSTHL